MSKTRVQSVSRACLILQLLGVKSQLSTLEISRYLELNRSTTHHLISTLQDHGFVQLNKDNKYSLGPSIFELINQTPENVLKNIAHGLLEKVVERTGETTYFSIFNKGVVILDIVSGEGALRVVHPFPEPGEPLNLHARASGKLYLSTLTLDELDEYLLRNPLEKLAKNTIIEKEMLISELEKIRNQGFAEDDEEFCDGVICYAHPIRFEGKIIGCVSTSLPTVRKHKYSNVIKNVEQVSNKLEEIIDQPKYIRLLKL